MNRPRDKFGNHDGQQHLRYVEVYTIDDPEVEDQPVQVKLLKWGGSSYAVYGAAFRVGDVSLAASVTTGDRFWITRRRDALRWERIAGIGDHYQLVRGVTTAAVVPADPTFQITSITAYEEHAATPTAPLWVVPPAGGVTLSAGAEVWAAYRENVLTFDPGTGTVQVDWRMIPLGSGSSTPVRGFELTVTKTRIQEIAYVKWLGPANTPYGDEVVIYDPFATPEPNDQSPVFGFSGRGTGYLSGSPGCRGLAALRTYFGLLGQEDRWEIIAMEGLAETIEATVKFDDSSGSDGGYYLQFDLVRSGHSWNCRNPVAIGDRLTLDARSDKYYKPDEDDEVLAELVSADTFPPTYAVYSVKHTPITLVALELDVEAATGGDGWIDPTVTSRERLDWRTDRERYEVQGRYVKVHFIDTARFPVSGGKQYAGICGRDSSGELLCHTIVCTPYYKPPTT